MLIGRLAIGLQRCSPAMLSCLSQESTWEKKDGAVVKLTR